MRTCAAGRASSIAVSISIGVADVADSARRIELRSQARPSGVARWSRMRRHTPGMQCKRVARYPSIAAQIAAASLDS